MIVPAAFSVYFSAVATRPSPRYAAHQAMADVDAAVIHSVTQLRHVDASFVAVR